MGVDRSRPFFSFGRTRGGGQVGAHLDDGGQVLGGGTAAPADDRDAELTHELAVEFGELVGLEVIVHRPLDHGGKPGVGQAGDRDRGVAGQVPERLEHLRGSGGAVEADDVDVHGLEGHQGGADLGAGKHGPGELDGHLALDRETHPGPLHGPAGSVDRAFGLEQIEHRLHDDEIGAPLDQRVRLLLIGVAEIGIADLAQRGELGARADAAGHPPRAVRSGELFGCVPGQRHRRQVEFADPVALAVFGEHRGEGTERVGLDHVAADLVEGPVYLFDHVGTGDHEDLVAPFEVRAPEIVGGQIGQLEIGPHGAVEYDDALGDGLEVARFSGDGSHSPPTIPGSGEGAARSSRRIGSWDGHQAGATGRPCPSFSIGTVRTPC